MYDDNDNEIEEVTDTLSKKEFIVNVTNYYKTILKYKEDHKKDLATYWKPNYDDIQKQFEDIIDMFEYNWIEARNMIDKMQCFKFENFSQYVFNIDIKNTKHIKGMAIKAKTIRSKRFNKCPKCNIICNATEDDSILKCPKCGYEIVKNKAGSLDITINCEKHIRKHLDKIIGLSRIPSSLQKLVPYLTIWLTEWKYIYKWLLFSHRYDNFVYRYKVRTGSNLLYDDFDKTIARTENNKMSFIVYELFVEEFYKMTELMNKLSKKTTNVDCSDETVIEIIRSYLKNRKIESYYDLPEESFEYKYNNTNYQLGIYFGKLSLLIDYDEHNIKHKIVKEFCKDGIDYILFPGCFFNFIDLFKKSEQPPRSFIYSENYNHIMNEIFHSKFTIISSTDIEKIVKILLKYNDYYKNNADKTGKKRDTKTNSPLFVCVLTNLLTTFDYFKKYLPILEQLPHRVTDSLTKGEIDKLWVEFISMKENKDLLDLLFMNQPATIDVSFGNIDLNKIQSNDYENNDDMYINYNDYENNNDESVYNYDNELDNDLNLLL